MKKQQNKVALDSVVARQITKEVMDFGVTQDQILRVCKFLAFELEDVNAMKKIVSIIDEFIQPISDDNDNDHSQEQKLITDF